jgi:subfamily B ATP-binding cassette protein MsbA
MSSSNFMENSNLFWRACGPFKGYAIGVLVILISSAFVEGVTVGMLLPFISILMGDAGGGTTQLPQSIAGWLDGISGSYRLGIVGILFIILILGKGILSILQVAYSNGFVFRLRKSWTETILWNYLSARKEYIEAKPSGELADNIVIETARAAKNLLEIIAYIGRIFIVTVLLILMLFVDWFITCITVGVGIVLLLSTYRITERYSRDVGTKTLQLNQSLHSIVVENLKCIRDVKLFSLESSAIEGFKDGLNNLLDMQLKFRVLSRMPGASVETLISVVLVSLLLICYYLLQVDLIAVLPKLTVFVVALQRVLGNLSEMIRRRMNILSLLAPLTLVQAVERGGVQRERAGGVKAPKLRTKIAMSDVGVKYDGRRSILKGLNMAVERGKTTAIVGASGAGKSTIVDVLTGLVEPTEGEVLVEDTPLSKIDLADWRSRVGVVSQEVLLFNGTVKENIRLGRCNSTDGEIIESAKLAHAHSFIEAFPQAYDTVVGEQGSSLSGGQRQRIAIARAIVRNPDIYIFDEPTSALDIESEECIRNTVKYLAEAGKTIVIIAHRLTMIENADKVYRIENGRAYEVGMEDNDRSEDIPVGESV